MDLKIERNITEEPNNSCVKQKEVEDFYVRLAAGMSGFCYWCENFPLNK